MAASTVGPATAATSANAQSPRTAPKTRPNGEQHQQRARKEPIARPVGCDARDVEARQQRQLAQALPPGPGRGKPSPAAPLEHRYRERDGDSGEPELERHEPGEPVERVVRIGLDVAVGVDRVERGPEQGAERERGGETMGGA